MRIAVAMERADPARGGSERWGSWFCARAATAGHEVHLLAPDARSAPDGVIPVVLHAGGRTPAARFRHLAASVRRTLGEGPYDTTLSLGKLPGARVLMPHGGLHRTAIAAAIRSRGHGPARAVAGLLRRLSPKQRALLDCEAAAFRDPALRFAIALSSGIAEEMHATFGIPPERVRIVPNGADTARFRPPRPAERTAAREALGLPPDTPVLLFVGHVFRLKGLPTVLAALARLPGAHLLVAGRRRGGPHRTGRTRYLGLVEDIRPLYWAADVLALPTFHDPCSIATIEALASGLPVVTTRANGAAELLQGRAGEVLDDPHDVQRLTAALERVLEPGARGERRTAARTSVEGHDLERNFEAVMGVLAAAAGMPCT